MTDQQTPDIHRKRADFTAGLRAVADWYEQHPEIELPYCTESGSPVRFSTGIFPSYMDATYEDDVDRDVDDTAERFAAAVKALGGARVKEISDTAMRVTRAFGPGLSVELWATRERVCEAVVVGTKKVEVEREVVPAVTEKVVEEQDVIEWRCAPVLEHATAIADARASLQGAPA